MANKEKTPEEKLRNLGKDLRAGWQKLHPVTDKELASVRGVVREQWEKRQGNKKEEAHKEEAEKAERMEKEKQRRQSQEESKQRKSKGQDHGQSH